MKEIMVNEMEIDENEKEIGDEVRKDKKKDEIYVDDGKVI
jgi:hypothetical protein